MTNEDDLIQKVHNYEGPYKYYKVTAYSINMTFVPIVLPIYSLVPLQFITCVHTFKELKT